MNNLKKITILFLCMGLGFLGCRSGEELADDPTAPSQATNAQGLTLSALKKQEIGAYKEAIGELKRALEIDPDFVPAHFRMGSVFEEWDKKDKAVEAYKKVLEVEPENIDALTGLGSVYAKQYRNEWAIREYEKVFALKPEDPEIQFKIALEYWYIQKLPETVKSYQKVLDLNPDHLQAHLNLSSVYEKMKDYDNALKEISIALHLANKNNEKQAIAIAENKQRIFKGRMDMSNEEWVRRTQPPFEY